MKQDLELREYQSDFVKLGHKRNIIVCLPTGSGKTQIAVQLAKEYLEDTIRKEKKIIVIATTVALTRQHYETFKRYLPDVRPSASIDEYGIKENGEYSEEDEEKDQVHTVDYLSSDRDIDNWVKAKWARFFSNCHVIVMTPESLVRALNGNFMDMSQISLLVMDECHHTDKNHPMNQIMNNYHEKAAKNGRANLPRIIGLTATIINGKKTRDVGLEVEEVESRLDAKASTHWKYEEVLKHSTKAKVQYEKFSLSGQYSWSSQEKIIKSSLTDFQLELAKQNLKDFEPDRSSEVDHPSFSPERAFNNKRGEVQKYGSILKDIIQVYDELGPYCGYFAARYKRAFIKSLVKFTNAKAKEFYLKLDNALAQFEACLNQLMSKNNEAEKVEHFRTEKLGLLLKILDNYRSDPESLCGIVFVQQRLTTQVLCWYLQAFSRYVPRGNHIRANFVMGASNTEMDAREKLISIKEQTKVLQGFRSKQYNVLISTNVIEEGLDVPICNLIIRLDSIQNYPSFIQSLGRARDPNSKFIAFINKNNTTNEEATYEKFLVFNQQLSAHLRKAALHPFFDDEDDDEDYKNGPVSQIPDFSPYLSEGRRYPAIPASKSISVVHEYCQTLASDRFASFQPISWHEKVGFGFKAWVQLPSNSVIRDVDIDGVVGGIVEGDVQPTKRLAKCSAFLKVCEQLFYQKCLDPETLLPFPRKHNQELIKMINSLKDGMEKDPEGRKVGSKKRTQQYIKKIPDCLNEVLIQPGKKCRVYQIVIEQEPKKYDILSNSIYRFTNRLSSFGLIVPASVDLKIPKFFLHVNPTIGFLTVELKPVQYLEGGEMEPGLISFAGEFLRSIQDFERYIYGDILGLKSIFMEAACFSSMLLVPLQKIARTQKLRIHSELIHNLLGLQKETDGFWQTVPSTRLRFDFERHPYGEMDSLVVPWYNFETETEFCAVVEVSQELTPLSPFPVRSGPQLNYKKYFLDKYPKIKSIKHDQQNLIRVKKIGKNLNFFTNSKNVGKSHAESENILELIPELTRIHPLPASLYIQAKFLSSILHRINRLLLAKEIEEKVNSPSLGSRAQGCKSHVQRIRSLTLSYEDEKKYLKIGQSNVSSLQDSTENFKSPISVGKKMKIYNETKGNSLSTKDDDDENNNIDMRLDFINPLDYSSNYELSKMTTEIRYRKQARKPFTDTNCQQKKHYLIDVNSTLLTRLKKYDTDFNSVTYPSISSNQPTLFSLMQAMTVSNARDFFSLERLETIGDSFLKFAVTKFLFSNYTKLSEGRMTELKSFLVSNAHLYRLGKKNFGLGEYLSSGIFVPETAFLPPGFVVSLKLVEAARRHDINEDIFVIDEENIERFENWSAEELDEWIVEKKPLIREFQENNKKKMKPENTGLVYTRVGDKSVADSVEALLGAYYLAGKATGAYQFMEKLGLQGPLLKKISMVETEEVEWIPLQNCPPMTSFGLINKDDSSVGTHLPQYEELQKLINYKFKEPWLLVQAFSHPCYMANNTTPPYERLEFIGDAILDFLITDHIYQTGELNPGQLTDLRSALVNNVTFGSLAVRYGFHKFILGSQDITAAIRTFVDFQEQNNHEITEPFSWIEEDEALVVEDIDVPKILGDIWESLAGGIYIDSGYSLDAVWRVFYRLMKTEIDLFSKNVPTSPVKRFHEKFPQVRHLFTNVSEEWREKENMNRELTYIQLNIPHENYKEIIGMGKNKKSAKLAACKYAMKFLWNV